MLVWQKAKVYTCFRHIDFSPDTCISWSNCHGIAWTTSDPVNEYYRASLQKLYLAYLTNFGNSLPNNPSKHGYTRMVTGALCIIYNTYVEFPWSLWYILPVRVHRAYIIWCLVYLSYNPMYGILKKRTCIRKCLGEQPFAKQSIFDMAKM